MKKLIATVEIPKYERLIKLSNAVRPKYLEKDKDTLALKYCNMSLYKETGRREPNTDLFDWEEYKCTRNGKKTTIFILYDLVKKERVIKNENVAGKPKHETISANKLHRLTMASYTRANIINTLKEQFIPYVDKLDPITEFPIIIELEIQDTYMDEIEVNGKIGSKQNWDVGNRAMFYNKVFEDVLTGCISDVETGAYQKKGGKRKAVTVKKTTTKVIIPDDHRGYVTGSPGALFTPISNTENRKLIYRIYHDQREVIQNNKHYKQ